MRAKTSLAFASMLMGAVAVLASPADAACKKFGFTVNDYGKDGPTNDAKNLLDKHISEWAAQNGVTDYSTGKKTVSCELFLDVILFDEHTCTASATVCWGPDAKKLGAQSAAAPEGDAAGASAGAPPAPVRKAHAMGHATEQAAAAAAAPAAEAASAAAAPLEAAPLEAAPLEAAPTAPVEQIAAPDEAPAAAPAVHAAPQAQEAAGNTGGTTGAVVETGALQAGQALPHSSQKPATAGASEKDRAAAATAAASAAAAAERAAVAAETAANAAKEAAAAAVAASAASKGSATVPPLNHASGATPAHAE